MVSSDAHIYTPSELNREVRMHIETGFPRILLEAEISNLSRPASGHLYFSLKDDRAQIRCALFRSAASRLGIRPENGMKVLARGRISLYEPRGDFQLIVDGLQEAGEGLLRRQFEELKNKLEAEGLFEASSKQSLPAYPQHIAIVTSPGGAVIRDILHVLARRWPIARIRLYPVSVQGSDAAEEIVSAIRSANLHQWADLLIVGRGGGSLEDLAAFNEENVARAVFTSNIPVVSAVGHETDFSICDFVSDLRAPTPSAAAELATPDQAALKESFVRAGRSLQRRMRTRFERDTQRLDHASHRLRQRHPASRLNEQLRQLTILRAALLRVTRRQLVERNRMLDVLSRRLRIHHPGRKMPELIQRVSAARQSLRRAVDANLRERGQNLRELARTLNAVSPLETVSRGYAVVTSLDSGEVISSISQAQTGQAIIAQLQDGRLTAAVEAIDDKALDSKPR